MDKINFLKDFFESIQDYNKIVFLMFLDKIDADFLTEYGFLKDETNRLVWENENFLLEQNEQYLVYIKNEN